MSLRRISLIAPLALTVMLAAPQVGRAFYMPSASDPAYEEFKLGAVERDASLRWGSHARPLADSTHSFDVLHYDAHFFVPYDLPRFSAEVMITLRVHDPLTPIELNAVGMDVDSLRLDDDTASFAATGTIVQVLAERLDTNVTHTIHVWYQSSILNTGIYRLDRTIYTMSEPSDARYWLISYDEPFYKATCDIWVTAPAERLSSANGTPVDSFFTPDFTIRHWTMIYPISTYLICFNVGDFAYFNDAYIRPTPTGADTIPLNYYVHPEDTASARAAFHRVPEMFANYERRFGRF